MQPHPLRTLAAETLSTLKLAGPVVAGQLGIMLMGLVDTAMVGRLGPQAVAAVGVGSSLYAVVFMFGMGTLLGLDRIVAFAFGAGRTRDCGRALVQGFYVATAASLPLVVAQWVLAGNLARFDVDPRIVPDAVGYLRILSWSLWPALLFTALRQVLQAMGDVAGATVVLLLSNVVNALANWVLIEGRFGLPALGTEGSALATLISRVFMLLALVAHAWRVGLFARALDWRPDVPMLRELAALGLPAAGQLLLEGGVFSLATVLAAGLGTVPGAAHQIVLQVASFTFMVPLGLSAAGAVRVGQALGRDDVAAARRAGWAVVALGVTFMLLSALTLVSAAGPIVGIFTSDVETVRLAGRLLFFAGLFQLFDGAQVTLSGVLRGVGETVAPLVANLAGHWCVGLPIGWLLCYQRGWGVVGLWIGLAAGLAAVAIALLGVWHRRIERVVAAGA